MYRLLDVASIEASYNKFVKRVAANIKATRKARGYSQKAMEAKFGYDVRNYQRIESGSHSPSVYTLFKIARDLGVDVSDLVKE